MVFEVPSMQLLMPYDACKVNSPVLDMLTDGTLLGNVEPSCDQYIVVPTEA
jgi:hypothetical protein